MKQILQNLGNGHTSSIEVPIPSIINYNLIICSHCSLISAGTERMLVSFGKSSLMGKARSQPDKVKQVIDKIKTDGLANTIHAIRSKLDQPLPLGYCNVGIVTDVRGQRSDVGGLSVGDRVVSNGPHAEVVSVPENLCAKVPDSVSDEAAVFSVLGAIGLQGIRLAQPTLGEVFVVTGLGLIGQLTAQLLMAHGCRVMGIDMDPKKCVLAEKFGITTVDLSKGEDPLQAADQFSRGNGVDGVLITAATKSSRPVHQAAQMCRKRGRIVLIGVTGLELSRADFYEKELSFQVSCSYGPGRYDPVHEEKGIDYPFGFVRWTEKRNFEAVLDMMAAGKIDVGPLITHRFAFEDAEKAYQLISENTEPYLGIILDYGKDLKEKDPQIRLRESATPRQVPQISDRTIRLKEKDIETSTDPKQPVIGLIGAGNYTGQVLLPALTKTGARLKKIASGGGVSGTHNGKKFGFELSTTDIKTIFDDPDINTVFITTRHNTHARFAIDALEAGKNVFVEKPLCLTLKELDSIQSLYASRLSPNASRLLMVGFNRRFAPHIVKAKQLLNTVHEPKSMIMTVNAGAIPIEHWTQDPEVGGGRIIGEACHFIDLLRFLAGFEISSASMKTMPSKTNDTVTMQLGFKDGSMGTVHYFANGNKAFPKEKLEIFTAGRILQLDNFRVLRGYGWKGFKTMKSWRQDKGHAACTKAFVQAVAEGKDAPIPFEEIVEVTQTTLSLVVQAH
ncbi:oxidoreductase domain protein [Desulfosarcina variabilis str. Montpellier]|uniref:bi-domain-containing oxidoreductase n=1 Tax=Desulfosarcina variabilis TaxID=2300 RepID=UPI003AFB10AE